MSRKHKKVCTTLNYIKHFLNLVCGINGCILIFYFFSLLGVHIGITSFLVRLNICTIAAGIKRYKPIIKKK